MGGDESLREEVSGVVGDPTGVGKMQNLAKLAQTAHVTV